MLKYLLKKHRRPLFNEAIWTTLTGQQLRLVDMTDDHLRNTIFYIQRRAMQLDMQDWSMASSLGLDPGKKFPIYYNMLHEANRRNLTWTNYPAPTR
jgi:hypothetical protein